MNFFKSYLFILLLLMLSFKSLATINPELYSANVPVASSSAEDRETAVQQAFIQVLVKLTGNSEIASVLKLSEKPVLASQYVQQYRYHQEMLAVDFDEGAINRYLKRQKVPIWGGVRPLTLIFIAAEEGGHQAIVNPYDVTFMHWQSLFIQDSQMRAIPVIFPLWDLQDQAQVTLNDIWYHASDKLQAMSQRYQAQNVLSGRIYKNPDNQAFAADWMLVVNDEKINWKNEASTKEELIRVSVNRFADELVKKAGNLDEELVEGPILMTVDNIHDVNSYLRILSYLQGITGVEKVSPQVLTQNQAKFTIQLDAPLSTFSQTLQKDNILQTVSQDGRDLHYRYF